MDFTAITIQEPAARMDPQGPDDILQQTVASVNKNMEQCPQQKHDLGTYTICPFPDFLVGIDDGIQSPKLASFGPRHRDKVHLHPFEKHKDAVLTKFLSLTESQPKHKGFCLEKLEQNKDKIKRCYSEKIVLPSDDDLVKMMLLDGSFMVELFRGYEEGRYDTLPWQWQCPVQILIADLLKLENQLPFIVLEELFKCSNIGQGASTLTLPQLALRFLNQAFCSPSDMVNSQIPDPKHLLDLFRSSLLPSTKTNPPQQSRHHPLVHSIQSVKELRSTGITLRKNIATSLLEIDFRKLQIPPLALKIPPVAIDELTNTILVNCVALEQCLPLKPKYFTAYVCFMNCLMKQPEDVGFLRSVDIITRVTQEEKYIINLLNSLGRNVSFSVQDCYLCKQLQEIHSYYNSSWASIRRNWFSYNNIMLYCSILQIAIGILSWRLSRN